MTQPSTWEAMVRAELGNGNRDEALALLERVKARYVACLFFFFFLPPKPPSDLDTQTFPTSSLQSYQRNYAGRLCLPVVKSLK